MRWSFRWGCQYNSTNPKKTNTHIRYGWGKNSSITYRTRHTHTVRACIHRSIEKQKLQSTFLESSGDVLRLKQGGGVSRGVENQFRENAVTQKVRLVKLVTRPAWETKTFCLLLPRLFHRIVIHSSGRFSVGSMVILVNFDRFEPQRIGSSFWSMVERTDGRTHCG